MLKKLALAIVVVVAGLGAYIAAQPSEFRITRAVTISAAPDKVFPHVNEFQKWEAWSPWAKLDPKAKVDYEGRPGSEGSVFKWSGNSEVGAGRMTLVESQPNARAKIKVDFTEPMEGTTTSDFTFKPEGAATRVDWTTSGHNDFLARAVCLFMNMDKVLGGAMERGLGQLKAVAEKPAT